MYDWMLRPTLAVVGLENGTAGICRFLDETTVKDAGRARQIRKLKDTGTFLL